MSSFQKFLTPHAQINKEQRIREEKFRRDKEAFDRDHRDRVFATVDEVNGYADKKEVKE